MQTFLFIYFKLIFNCLYSGNTTNLNATHLVSCLLPVQYVLGSYLLADIEAK